MYTDNFNLRYLEIALSSFIEDDEHHNIIGLIEYLQDIEEYSIEFPKVFEFKLPCGEIDTEYNQLSNWLIANCFCVKFGNKLQVTRSGIEFFKRLEDKCLEIEKAFDHYKICRC